MIVDLRDYTLKPDTRDRFIECCETVIFPEQERLGATILGTFRDAHQSNRVVWLRAMPDMAERKRILTAFYAKGEVWKANHRKVNSWLVDSHNVLLVKPVSTVAVSAKDDSVVAMYTRLDSEPVAAVEESDDVSQAITGAGGRLLVKLATDPSENNYPPPPNSYRRVWLRLVRNLRSRAVSAAWSVGRRGAQARSRFAITVALIGLYMLRSPRSVLVRRCGDPLARVQG